MSVRLDASADVLSRTTNLPTIGSFTMMGWFKISTDRNAFSAMFATGTNASNYFSLQTNTNGTTYSIYDNSGNTDGSALTVGTWYHLGWTGNATNLLGYLNGVQDISVSEPGTPASTSKIWVGSDFDTEWLNGCIAAVKIYSAVLTAAEIANEMRCYVPLRTLNLNAWHPLLSTADQTIDYSGAGNTITVGGTLATEDGPPLSWSVGERAWYVAAAGGGATIPLMDHQYRMLRAS